MTFQSPQPPIYPNAAGPVPGRPNPPRRKPVVLIVIASVIGVVVGLGFVLTLILGLGLGAVGRSAPRQDVSGVASTADAGSAQEPSRAGTAGPSPQGGPAGGSAGAYPVDSTPAGDPDGSFSNPFPLGSEFRTPEWTVVIDSVDLDATDAVYAGFAPGSTLPPLKQGHAFIQVNLSIAYTGTNPAGAVPWATRVAYVTAGGTSYGLEGVPYNYAANPIDQVTPVLPGSTTTGSIVLEVPASGVEKGVLALAADSSMTIFFVGVR